MVGLQLILIAHLLAYLHPFHQGFAVGYCLDLFHYWVKLFWAFLAIGEF